MARLFPAVVVVLLAAASLTSGFDLFQHDEEKDGFRADVGNWTVGDCILAQFALEFAVPNASVPLPKPGKNGTVVTYPVVVPADAAADKSQPNCGADKQVSYVFGEIE